MKKLLPIVLFLALTLALCGFTPFCEGSAEPPDTEESSAVDVEPADDAGPAAQPEEPASSEEPADVEPAPNVPDGVTEYDVWLNGERFTSDKLTVAAGGGSAVLDVSATPYKLTLNGVTVTQPGVESTGSTCGLYAKCPLVLCLVGQNTVGTSALDYGIEAEKALTITGYGSLSAVGRTCGLCGLESVAINSGSVTASGPSGLLCYGDFSCFAPKVEIEQRAHDEYGVNVTTSRRVAPSLLANNDGTFNFRGENSFFRVPAQYAVKVELLVMDHGGVSYALAAEKTVTGTTDELLSAVPALELDEMGFAGVTFFDRDDEARYALSGKGPGYIGFNYNGKEYGVEDGMQNAVTAGNVLPTTWYNDLMDAENGVLTLRYYFCQLAHVSANYGLGTGKPGVMSMVNILTSRNTAAITLDASLTDTENHNVFLGWKLNGQDITVAADKALTMATLNAASDWRAMGVLKTNEDGIIELCYEFTSVWKTYTVYYYSRDEINNATSGSILDSLAGLYAGDALPAALYYGSIEDYQYTDSKNVTYYFDHWALKSGTPGADNTVGLTDLYYEPIFTTPTLPPTPTPAPTAKPSSVPATGDGASPLLWLGLIALSGAALALLPRKKRG